MKRFIKGLKMIEKELKYLLLKNDYIKLKKYFESYGEKKRLVFIKTYYYDTIPFSLLPSIVFRVRLNEGNKEIFLSIKANILGRLPSEEREELQVSKELNYNIRSIKIDKIENKFPLVEEELLELGLSEEAISFINEIKKDLNLNERYLTALGITEIERLHGILPFYNMPFDLDYTKYYKADKQDKYFEDFELEIEDDYPEKFINIVSSIFKQNEISSSGSEKKIQRLLKYFTPHDNLSKS